MKTFQCHSCGEQLFFENTSCLGCGSMVGFVPSEIAIIALSTSGNNRFVITGDNADRSWKPCRNYVPENVCSVALMIKHRAKP